MLKKRKITVSGILSVLLIAASMQVTLRTFIQINIYMENDIGSLLREFPIMDDYLM